MKAFSHTAVSFARSMATVAIFTGALLSPSHASTARDSITLTSAPGISGSFVQLSPFSFSVTSALDYFSSRIDFPSSFSIQSFVATLSAGSLIVPYLQASPVDIVMPNSFFLGLQTPGTQLGISSPAGRISAADGYTRALRAMSPTAPDPEPEIWAMLLVGAGLVGMRLRRKSKLDGARHFV